MRFPARRRRHNRANQRDRDSGIFKYREIKSRVRARAGACAYAITPRCAQDAGPSTFFRLCPLVFIKPVFKRLISRARLLAFPLCAATQPRTCNRICLCADFRAHLGCRRNGGARRVLAVLSRRIPEPDPTRGSSASWTRVTPFRAGSAPRTCAHVPQS